MCGVMVAGSAVPSMLHESASLRWKAASISVAWVADFSSTLPYKWQYTTSLREAEKYQKLLLRVENPEVPVFELVIAYVRPYKEQPLGLGWEQ